MTNEPETTGNTHPQPKDFVQDNFFEKDIGGSRYVKCCLIFSFLPS